MKKIYKFNLNELRSIVKHIIRENDWQFTDKSTAVDGENWWDWSNLWGKNWDKTDDADEKQKIVAMYNKYGKKYPYACDAMLIWVDNYTKRGVSIVLDALKGVNGGNTKIDYDDYVEVMKKYRGNMAENAALIDSDIKNLPTKDRQTLKDHYNIRNYKKV